MHVVADLCQIPISSLVILIVFFLPSRNGTGSFQKIEIVCRGPTKQTPRFCGHSWVVIIYLLLDLQFLVVRDMEVSSGC
jgi:hypothetical protein